MINDYEYLHEYGYNEHAMLIGRSKPKEDAPLDAKSLAETNGIHISVTGHEDPSKLIVKSCSGPYIATAYGNTIDIHRDIVVSDCPKCGGNLPIREVDDKGICTCKFCGKDVYVWAKGE